MMIFNEKVRKRITSISVCFLIFGLTGCSNEDTSDLTQFIGDVKARPKGTIPALPEIKVVEPFIFNPEGLRNPFRPLEKKEDDEKLDLSSDTGIVPDISRRKEELEDYPLDSLKMVGTLSEGKGLWGLVKATDGTIHRVKKGNYMGQNYGEIHNILNDRIELMEIILEKPGSWREQQALLELADN